RRRDVRHRGHVRARRGARRGVACGRARGSRRDDPSDDGHLRHRGVRGASRAARGDPRRRPGRGRGRRARGARHEPGRGDRARAPRRRRRDTAIGRRVVTGEREHPRIRTPDQKIRVFVSSTLRELADERRAARAAIERMRLAPVMFELGARPHPPRSLYRSYLAQSDIFIGIYGDSYGWVAPDETVSGLEDEYDLAPKNMPKLIYVRASEGRDARLEELIARIREDDTAAYLPFRNAAELEDQIANDLAILLAERFDESRSEPEHAAPDASALAPRVPVPYTTTIGRERDIGEVRELLARGTDRVVSLIGPGGIGKS